MPSIPYQKIRPHLYKDIRILYRETQVMVVLIMPVLYTVIYSLFSKDPREVAKICFGMALSLCPLFIQAILIVSDKESGEMQTLMRAGARLGQMLASKALVACASTFAALLACWLILLVPPQEFAWLVWYMVPVLLTFLSLGTMLGFWYHTMQDVIVGKGFTGILLVLLVILPILASSSQAGWIRVVYSYYPTGLLAAAIEALGQPGGNQGELLRLLAISWLWAAVLLGFAVRLYKREISKEG